MLLLRKFVLMNQAPSDGSAGGNNGMGQGSQTPGSTPPPPPAQVPGQGTNALDYYGSQTPPPNPPAAPAGQSQPPAPPAQPPAAPPVSNASGYGNEPPPPAPPAGTPPVVPPAPPAGTPPAGDPPATPPPAAEVYKDLKVEGVDATYVETFKNFANANKFSPEQAQALFDLKKSEMMAMQAEETKAAQQHQERIKAQRTAWGQELRADPVFGGANFDSNVHIVNKYISEFLPETNKHLTTNKTMLPPYVMRDLHRNAMEAYKTDTFVNGAEGDTKGGIGDDYDPLSYYSEKKS